MPRAIERVIRYNPRIVPGGLINLTPWSLLRMARFSWAKVIAVVIFSSLFRESENTHANFCGLLRDKKE
jgi:hypothetical protein